MYIDSIFLVYNFEIKIWINLKPQDADNNSILQNVSVVNVNIMFHKINLQEKHHYFFFSGSGFIKKLTKLIFEGLDIRGVI